MIFALTLATLLITPALAARSSPRLVCVSIWDPGAGPTLICARRVRR